MTDTRRLRAAIFERCGIAIDEHDPIMAVLAASAQQSEEIGARLLARTSPVRIVVATAAVAMVFGMGGAMAGWRASQHGLEAARAEWARQQANPRMAALLSSEEGRAAMQLAELGVAGLLAKCNGRRAWRIRDGYCVPMTADGRPDGFRAARAD